MLWWRKPAPVNPEQMSIEATIGWALLSAVGAFVTSSALGFLFHILGLGIEEQPWIQALFADRSALYIVLPWLVVIGPLAEEVFFRGYMFRRLLESSGIGVAYAMTAITFGIIHFNFQAIPTYAAVALWFAFVQWRTGRLLAAVIGHMVYNGIVMAVGLLAGGAV